MPHSFNIEIMAKCKHCNCEFVVPKHTIIMAKGMYCNTCFNKGLRQWLKSKKQPQTIILQEAKKHFKV